MESALEKINKFKCLFFLLSIFLSQACGRAPQVSGIVAISKIETVACVAREKTIQVRNNNTDQSQRVQGVLFELGTNNDRYFKILSVEANGVSQKAPGNLAEEIILTPGGVMSVTVEYKPRKTTDEGEHHATYLDVVLNGPKLGVIQIEIQGTAPTALEGCEDAGEGRVFEVTAASTVLSHVNVGENEAQVPAAVGKQLILSEDGDNVYILPENWPGIVFVLPPNDVIDELTISLAEETGLAPLGADGSLTFENTTFSATPLTFSGLTLTTGSVNIDSTKAPKVAAGGLNLEGSPLNEEGETTLVVGVALVGNQLLETQEDVNEGAFGLKLSLKEKK